MEKLINDFKISYTKGDTYAIAVKFKKIAEDLRCAYFTVKENPDDEPLIQKSLGAGIDKIDDREYKGEKTYKVQLQADDTANLEANVQYLYDLQVTLDNVVKTVLSGVFVVHHSVTGLTSTITPTLEVAVDDEIEAELLTTPATNGIEYETDPVANARIGALSGLQTTAKETIVDAVNEVNNKSDIANNDIEKIKDGRTVVANAQEAEHATRADNATLANRATANDYNLGVFDTITDNGDGTATITRKTGVVYVSPKSTIHYEVPANGSNPYFIIHADAGEQDTDHPSVKHLIDGLSAKACNTLPLGTNVSVGETESCIWTGNYDDRSYVYIRKPEITTAEGMREWLSRNPTYLYGELAAEYAYTEKVVTNQPLNVLSQQGNMWLYNEWLKGLNFFDIDNHVIDGITSKENAYTLALNEGYYDKWQKFATLPVKKGQTYTISLQGMYSDTVSDGGVNVGNILISVMNGQNTDYATPNSNPNSINLGVIGDAEMRNGKYTKTKLLTFTAISDWVTLCTSCKKLYHIMITEGNILYPCEPYNGGIVREKELKQFKKEVNERLAEYPNGVVTDTELNAFKNTLQSGATVVQSARLLDFSVGEQTGEIVLDGNGKGTLPVDFKTGLYYFEAETDLGYALSFGLMRIKSTRAIQSPDTRYGRFLEDVGSTDQFYHLTVDNSTKEVVVAKYDIGETAPVQFEAGWVVKYIRIS